MPDIEFFPGCFYETRDRQKLVCLKVDAPNETYPVICMNIENGSAHTYKTNGRQYSHSEDNKDILFMIPDEPDYEIIAQQKIIQERVNEVKRVMREIKKLEKEEEKTLVQKPSWQFWR